MASSSSSSITSLLSQIKQTYDSPASSSSTSTTPTLLVQAKVQLAQSGLLLPSSSSSSSTKDLETARDILSYGALLSVRNRDIPAFERYLAQLKPFWDPSLGCVQPLFQLVVTGTRASLHLLFTVLILISVSIPAAARLQPLAIGPPGTSDRSRLAPLPRK